MPHSVSPSDGAAHIATEFVPHLEGDGLLPQEMIGPGKLSRV